MVNRSGARRQLFSSNDQVACVPRPPGGGHHVGPRPPTRMVRSFSAGDERRAPPAQGGNSSFTYGMDSTYYMELNAPGTAGPAPFSQSYTAGAGPSMDPPDYMFGGGNYNSYTYGADGGSSPGQDPGDGWPAIDNESFPGGNPYEEEYEVNDYDPQAEPFFDDMDDFDDEDDFMDDFMDDFDDTGYHSSDFSGNLDSTGGSGGWPGYPENNYSYQSDQGFDSFNIDTFEMNPMYHNFSVPNYMDMSYGSYGDQSYDPTPQSFDLSGLCQTGSSSQGSPYPRQFSPYSSQGSPYSSRGSPYSSYQGSPYSTTFELSVNDFQQSSSYPQAPRPAGAQSYTRGVPQQAREAPNYLLGQGPNISYTYGAEDVYDLQAMYELDTTHGSAGSPGYYSSPSVSDSVLARRYGQPMPGSPSSDECDYSGMAGSPTGMSTHRSGGSPGYYSSPSVSDSVLARRYGQPMPGSPSGDECDYSNMMRSPIGMSTPKSGRSPAYDSPSVSDSVLARRYGSPMPGSPSGDEYSRMMGSPVGMSTPIRSPRRSTLDWAATPNSRNYYPSGYDNSSFPSTLSSPGSPSDWPSCPRSPLDWAATPNSRNYYPSGYENASFPSSHSSPGSPLEWSSPGSPVNWTATTNSSSYYSSGYDNSSFPSSPSSPGSPLDWAATPNSGNYYASGYEPSSPYDSLEYSQDYEGDYSPDYTGSFSSPIATSSPYGSPGNTLNDTPYEC